MQIHAVSPRWKHRAPQRVVRHDVQPPQVIANSVPQHMINTTRYDAIVIGSGISGGWAAKELCEKGLKTLVLERGRDVEHIKDYPTMNTPRWQFDLRGDNSKQWNDENPIISKAAG